MLEIKVHDGEKNVVLRFEHSLLSLSKWEARTKKAFLTSRAKTPTETIEYFQDMLVDDDVDHDLVFMLSPEDLDRVGEYINESRTASSVPDDPKGKRPSGEVLTSELIYYWLAELSIPFHPTETWHLSRIMMLIEITGFKKQPPKKRKPSEVMNDWRQINERQKKMFNTSG